MTQGCVGAGTGTKVGGLKGGVGTASAALPGGATVGALAVVNAAGSAVDLRTGELLGRATCWSTSCPGCGRRSRATSRPRSRPPPSPVTPAGRSRPRWSSWRPISR